MVVLPVKVSNNKRMASLDVNLNFQGPEEAQLLYQHTRKVARGMAAPGEHAPHSSDCLLSLCRDPLVDAPKRMPSFRLLRRHDQPSIATSGLVMTGM